MLKLGVKPGLRMMRIRQRSCAVRFASKGRNDSEADHSGDRSDYPRAGFSVVAHDCSGRTRPTGDAMNDSDIEALATAIAKELLNSATEQRADYLTQFKAGFGVLG